MACPCHTRERAGESRRPPARAATALALALIALTLAAGCGASPARVSGPPAASSTAGPTTQARGIHAPGSPGGPGAPGSGPGQRHHARRHPLLPTPATLPQTSQLPSATTAVFRAEMRALWRGIRAGSARPAMPAFFPEAAYAQVKTIGDPQADWSGRLVADYALDIAAAHRLLAAHAAHAQLVAVNVPGANAHWVPPGICDNGVGYYEVPNSRLVYRDAGEVRSFGIASLISWRGRWYVVHLGAITRSAAEGIVDDPESGEGVSVPSSAC